MERTLATRWWTTLLCITCSSWVLFLSVSPFCYCNLLYFYYWIVLIQNAWHLLSFPILSTIPPEQGGEGNDKLCGNLVASWGETTPPWYSMLVILVCSITAFYTVYNHKVWNRKFNRRDDGDGKQKRKTKPPQPDKKNHLFPYKSLGWETALVFRLRRQLNYKQTSIQDADRWSEDWHFLGFSRTVWYVNHLYLQNTKASIGILIRIFFLRVQKLQNWEYKNCKELPH